MGKTKVLSRKKSQICLLLFILTNILQAQVHPLINAHSHNDYKHKKPLSDALNNGFLSLEADIFLIRNELIVSHIYPILKKKHTLESLYLKPLNDSIAKHHGSVYENNDSTLILLIELKSEASSTYKELEKLLYKYKNILSSYENGEITKRAITIIITGNKPFKELENENLRFAFIDKNLLALTNTTSNLLCPLASAKYSTILNWKGKGIISTNEKQKLIEIVTKAHAQNIKVRLWASPENENVWKLLWSRR